MPLILSKFKEIGVRGGRVQLAMDELEIRVIKKPSKELGESLTDFAEKNWGEHTDTDTENNKLNFFDTPNYWIVGYFGDQVVGLLEVFIRSIEFEGNHLKMAGIGGVVTSEKHRRLGVMSSILKYSFDTFLPKQNLDIAMLCTNIPKLGGLYGRVGFVPILRAYYFVDKNGMEKSETDGMIAAVSNSEVVEKIIKSNTKLFVGRSNF